MDLSIITESIAQFEGFNTPGSIASANNNPGNIIWGNFAQNHGAIGQDSRGFAIFENVQKGFEATNALVEKLAGQGKSIREIISTWAPPDAPGNTSEATNNYINFVAKNAGLSPDVPVIDPKGWLPDWAGKVIGGVLIGPAQASRDAQNAVTTAVETVSFFSDPSRIAAALLGLICIAGAIFLLQPAGVGYLAGGGYARMASAMAGKK